MFIKKTISTILVISLTITLFACAKTEEVAEEVPVFQTLSYEALQQESYSSITPITYEYVEEESILAKQGTVFLDGKAYADGYWWIASQTTKGTPKKSTCIFKYTYDIDGNQISRIVVPGSTKIIESEDIVYKYYGYIQAGSIFYPSSFTKFGSNCGGCHANPDGFSTLASGIGVGLHSVRQANGVWEDGITFEGYYMIAMNSPIPICTLVEVSNHSFKGEGIEPGVPFRAIVADRGVVANHVDLFVGDENNLNNVIKTKKKNNIKVTIISIGKKVKKNGMTYCDV